MKQYGFFIDQSRCIGCNTCTVACLQWHDIQPGSIRWMRVYQWEKGSFPDINLHIVPIPCFHCKYPVCLKACPNKAIYKEKKYGVVLVDPDKCTGSRKCFDACPYGAPQFDSDEKGTKMSKCNMCIDRLQKGLKPICVLSCSMRALEFGPIEEMQEKYGNLKTLVDMPDGKITQPSVVFKPADPKSKVLPWDSAKVLKLWKKRQPREGKALPDIFDSELDIVDVPEGTVGRSRLALKAKDSEELRYYTTDNE